MEMKTLTKNSKVQGKIKQIMCTNDFLYGLDNKGNVYKEEYITGKQDPELDHGWMLYISK